MIEENELDLIITDVMMPEMDGLEFTQIIKSKVETCRVQLYRKIKQMTELSPNDYIKSILT